MFSTFSMTIYRLYLRLVQASHGNGYNGYDDSWQHCQQINHHITTNVLGGAGMDTRTGVCSVSWVLGAFFFLVLLIFIVDRLLLPELWWWSHTTITTGRQTGVHKCPRDASLLLGCNYVFSLFLLIFFLLTVFLDNVQVNYKLWTRIVAALKKWA